ncbi:MAG: hypothetical protein MZV63_22005 [Marinilabiliales bacterium]|nr:hypothetical protein [Marinilabiliales bacterium]
MADWVILHPLYTIPAGQKYYIIWRPINVLGIGNSRMSIEESSDGATWSPKTNLPTAPSTIFLSEAVTASVKHRSPEDKESIKFRSFLS